MYLCEMTLGESRRERDLRIDSPTSNEAPTVPPQPTEPTVEQSASTLAPEQACGEGPQIETQPPRVKMTVESIRAFRR